MKAPKIPYKAIREAREKFEWQTHYDLEPKENEIFGAGFLAGIAHQRRL